jgi:hypothetical protein
MTEVEVSAFSESHPEEVPLELDVECERSIGNHKYRFFTPLDIGDFVVYCWVRQQLTKKPFGNFL